EENYTIRVTPSQKIERFKCERCGKIISNPVSVTRDTLWRRFENEIFSPDSTYTLESRPRRCGDYDLVIKLSDLVEYEQECYNDSARYHSYNPKHLGIEGCYEQTGDLMNGYDFKLVCTNKDHFSYKHKTPTFKGFIEWLKVDVIQKQLDIMYSVKDLNNLSDTLDCNMMKNAKITLNKSSRLLIKNHKEYDTGCISVIQDEFGGHSFYLIGARLFGIGMNPKQKTIVSWMYKRSRFHITTAILNSGV
ncbi:MAG: hypothetical protein ACTSSP_08485, partial [Candidatus Asgardarchaeia archaeon]